MCAALSLWIKVVKANAVTVVDDDGNKFNFIHGNNYVYTYQVDEATTAMT